MHEASDAHLVSCLPLILKGRPDRHEEEQQHEEKPAPTDWPLPEALTEYILSALATEEDRGSLHAAMCACRDLRMAGSRLMTYARIESPSDLGRFPRMATLKRLAVRGMSAQTILLAFKAISASVHSHLRTVESFTSDCGRVSDRGLQCMWREMEIGVGHPL